MVPRIIVEFVPNPIRRVYHVTMEISQAGWEEFSRPLRDIYGGLEKVGELGAALLSEIFEIPGITHVGIEPYALNVEIGKAFEWKDIQPKVIKVLMRFFGDEADQVEVVYPPETPEEEKLI